MRQVVRVRGLGAAWGVAGGLWAASAFAQDAGVDAAAPSQQGPLAAATLVYPPPGATDVVRNPGLILRLDQAVLMPSINPVFSSPDMPSLPEGLLLRDDSGRLIAAGKMRALETARAFAEPQAPANTHVEISTTPFELSPQTHYQVLSRVAVCSAQDGVRVACLQEEYVVIGDMTTGTDFDRQGPMIASVTNGPTPGQCLAALSVVASDDHATASALRFAIDTLAYLGPDVVLPTPISVTDEGRTTVSVVPIDPSNNQGPGFEIDVESCYLPETDRLQPTPLRQAPAAPAADSSASGCALAPRPAPAASGVGSLFLLLTLLPIARRRLQSDPG